MLNCPNCNRIIMDRTQNGGYKVRSRMLLFSEGKAQALCPTCKVRVEVPILLGDIDSTLPKAKIVVNS